MRVWLHVAGLISLNFLWTGTAYMIQTYRLLRFLDGATVNLLNCGLYYLFQAAGIGAVALLMARRPAIAGGRLLPSCAGTVTLVGLTLAVLSSNPGVVIACGVLMNLTIGALSCCYIMRLNTALPPQRRGLAFGCAYALGSVGTWLLSLPGGGRFLWSGGSVVVVALVAAPALMFLGEASPPRGQGGAGPAGSRPDGGLIRLAAVVLFLMWMNNMLGFSFPLKEAAGSVYIEFARAFYALGLIIAGLISDRDRRWGALCSLAALAFPSAALALGGAAAGETLMWMLAYLFLGFLSVHRILVFSDIAERAALPALAVLGLAAGRLGEAAGTLGAGLFSGTPLVVLAGAVFFLVVISFFHLYQKLYSPASSAEELSRQQRALYGHRFSLSAREQEIFGLIVEGRSNAEIAAALYITESTVKFHAGNIFRKTGLANRGELIADFKLGRPGRHSGGFTGRIS